MKTILLVCLALFLSSLKSNAQDNFTRITDVAPVTDRFDGAGCAFIDYDNDGFDDLFVANASGNNYLYHNEHDGTFIAVTTGDIVNEGFHDSYGVAWGDFDNNGFLDLFVGNGIGTGTNNFLYRNNGDGTFTKITNGDIVTVRGHFSGCAWADYDRDGFLDLFVANNSSGPSLLLRNEGGTSFTTINSAASVTSDAIGAAWADFNNDGWPDVFVANGYGTDFKPNFLYANSGGGNFQRVLPPNFSSASSGSVGVAWGDYDNDGFSDVFVANSGADRESNELYHNNGNGTFTRVMEGEIATLKVFSITPAWGDYDNDGWLDLFVGNRDGTYPSLLYHNNRDGTFTRITDGPIASLTDTAGGCAWGDYDNDGFLDLFVSTLGVDMFPNESNALFHNDGNSNHWLKVKCEGAVSNRAAIGAKVRVKATINGTTFWQLREITSGDGFGGSALIAHFGLGDATNINTVRIEWPSGTVQEISNVPASQFLTVTEPARLQALGEPQNGSFKLALTGGLGFRYDVETSNDLASWKTWMSLTCTNRTMTLSDTNANAASSRYYRAVKR